MIVRALFCFVFALLPGVSIYAQADCPSVIIQGPAGVVPPGQPISFRVEVKGTVASNIGYHWTVSRGTILSGQGTNAITVSSEKWRDPSTDGSVVISGLPPGCANSVAERYAMSMDWITFLGYESLTAGWAEERRRLDDLDLAPVLEGPFTLHIIFGRRAREPRPPGRSRIRSLINYFIQTRKVPADRIFFGLRDIERLGRPEKSITQIYFVPLFGLDTALPDDIVPLGAPQK